jgi:hypothetical protein
MATERPATIVTQTRVRAGQNERFAGWQARMSARVARAPGFVSQQIIPADPPAQPDWVIIQRFDTRADARAWLDSDARADMLADAGDILVGDDSISVLDEAVDAEGQGSTAVIRTDVLPGQEQRFRAWHDKVEVAQARAPGYVGCALQAPIEGVQDDWVTILAFDSNEHLQQWLSSKERAALMAETETFMHDTQLREVASGFEGWFRFGAPTGAPAAPPWKLNYLILLGLYPIVMLEIIFLNPKLEWMPLPFGNLIGNVLSVAILGWPVVAILSRVMAWWMTPPPDSDRWVHVRGAAVILLVLAVLVGVFWIIDANVDVAPITEL